MKRGFFSPPDREMQYPLLELLPANRPVGDIARFSSSFFARYEYVQNMDQPVSDQRELRRRASAEEAMLRAVLEWLRSRPAVEG